MIVCFEMPGLYAGMDPFFTLGWLPGIVEAQHNFLGCVVFSRLCPKLCDGKDDVGAPVPVLRGGEDAPRSTGADEVEHSPASASGVRTVSC